MLVYEEVMDPDRSPDSSEATSIITKLGMKMLVTAVLVSIAFFVSLQMTTPHESQNGASISGPVVQPIGGPAAPESAAVEERLALRVLELAAKGDHEQAQREAAAFLRDYPKGTFSERVRNAAR